jgi:tetratricopeptide (TPR) repeat protein
MPAARSLFEQALASYKESDDEYNVAVTAGTLAEAEFRCGDAEAAIRVAEEGLEAARALGRAVRLEAWLLGNMAAFQLERERFENARERAREALRLARVAEVEIDVVFALQHLATVAALRPPDDDRPAAADRESAARLLGYVDARLAALGVVREVTEQDLYDKALSALRANLESSTLAGCIEAGGAYSEERAVTESLTL